MAVTFGFYNSRNGDRVYDARQMSSIFSGIISDGVFENFPETGQHFHTEWLEDFVGSKVVVGPGRAWLHDTWTDSDANMVFEIDPPNQNPDIERVDAIVLEINTSNDTHITANMSEAVPGRTNKFIVLRGSEAQDPVKPPLQNGHGIYQHYIALVRVGQEHHYISNMVGVAGGTPYIVGAVREPLSTADILDIWTQAFNAEIDRFRANANSEITAACEAYFEDPNSPIHQEVQESYSDLDDRLTAQEANLEDMSNRNHVWLIDCPVSPTAGYAVTYSKYGGSNNPPLATPPHNIYPDFFGVGAITNGVTLKVGDIVIGTNGYYAVVTHYQYMMAQWGYSMIIQSTGKSVTSDTLTITFSGGRYKDGRNKSSAPTCSVTFPQIVDALSSGRHLACRMEFDEAITGQGIDPYDDRTFLDANIEFRFHNQEMDQLVASALYYSEERGHLVKHMYSISSDGTVSNGITSIV